MLYIHNRKLIYFPPNVKLFWVLMQITYILHNYELYALYIFSSSVMSSDPAGSPSNASALMA